MGIGMECFSRRTTCAKPRRQEHEERQKGRDKRWGWGRAGRAQSLGLRNRGDATTSRTGACKQWMCDFV